MCSCIQECSRGSLTDCTAERCPTQRDLMTGSETCRYVPRDISSHRLLTALPSNKLSPSSPYLVAHKLLTNVTPCRNCVLPINDCQLNTCMHAWKETMRAVPDLEGVAHIIHEQRCTLLYSSSLKSFRTRAMDDIMGLHRSN